MKTFAFTVFFDMIILDNGSYLRLEVTMIQSLRKDIYLIIHKKNIYDDVDRINDSIYLYFIKGYY